MSTPRLPRRRRAFTLVEVIATLVIISVVGMASSRIIAEAFKTLDSSNTRMELSSQVNNAMERIVAELRTIQILSGSTPSSPDITACTATSISFRNTSAATRTISLSGTNLVFTGDAAAAQNLATNVTAFTIQGYDKNNAALPASPTAAQIATMRRIEVTITATSGGLSETLKTKVFIRCLGLGSGAS